MAARDPMRSGRMWCFLEKVGPAGVSILSAAGVPFRAAIIMEKGSTWKVSMMEG